ncbi:MAG: hypothetical protein JWR72_588 [Flavisolibacter sp.]|nr:hypothetical protein [Flavisolibacter sp.]
MKNTLLLFATFLLMLSAKAEVRLPRLVRDSMVLQRDQKINIWGWASAGEKVTVKFNNKTYKTTSGNNGKWLIQLASMKAGGPYTMDIDATNHITLKEILIGDVWVCSGQSNMVHQMILHRERYEQDIVTANYPQIRHFWIPTMTDLRKPQDDLPTGNWKWANPQDVLQFSAVAYFFAKTIYEKYGVPIGLINASVGGPPIEAWISEEGLKEFPTTLGTIQKNKDTAYVNSVNRAAFAYNASRPKPKDKGLLGAKPWYDTTYSPKGWLPINIPGYWEDQGVKDLDGIVWYWKVLDVPASMTGMPAKISMGRIVDVDFLYLNGKLVGTTGYQYPQRRYTLPAGLLKVGKNILVIRVINNAGKGGFIPDKPYHLTAGGQTLDLKGEWQYKVGDVFIADTKQAPNGIALDYQPTALFNAMVAPITNYSIKGILWYQGEGNLSDPSNYEKLLPTLITDWRTRWRQGNVPFLYVQLPNFGEARYVPAESGWAVLREGQRKNLAIPNTGMAVAIDLGEWNDIHPDNKKDVGVRLALSAQHVAYSDEKVVHSGPLYRTATQDGNKIILSFSNTGSGLITNDGEELSHFAIAGADKKFVWAAAKIDSNKIIVWNEAIANPMYVRYAWADNPVGANLYNKEGLPASPFEAEIISPKTVAANNSLPWNGKGAAVVLTYDDGLNVHLTNAVPALNSVGLKGTFYIADYFGGLQAQLPKWKMAAADGHELANHTVYHPCAGGPGREFVNRDYDLNNYSVRRITDEMKTMNMLLNATDGKTERTFAFPCSDTKIRDTAYIDYSKKDFIAARAVRNEMLSIDKANLYNLPSYMINGQSGDELIALVKKAMVEKKLLVFLFHGVGGEHGLNISLEAHHKLLQFLKQNEKEIWIAPMIDVAKEIKNYQSQHKQIK